MWDNLPRVHCCHRLFAFGRANLSQTCRLGLVSFPECLLLSNCSPLRSSRCMSRYRKIPSSGIPMELESNSLCWISTSKRYLRRTSGSQRRRWAAGKPWDCRRQEVLHMGMMNPDQLRPRRSSSILHPKFCKNAKDRASGGGL